MYANFMYVLISVQIGLRFMEQNIPFGLVVDKSEEDIKNIFVADNCSVIFEFEELESEYVYSSLSCICTITATCTIKEKIFDKA